MERQRVEQMGTVERGPSLGILHAINLNPGPW